MKKWVVFLGIVAIISIISEVVAESKRLEEPIVLEVVMDFDFNSVYVSYVTNNQKPMRIEWVEINGSSLFPDTWGFDMFGGGEIQTPSFKDGRYYSIYETQMTMNDWHREELLANPASVEKANVHFSGHVKAYEADVLVVMPSSEIGYTVNGWEKEPGKMTMDVIAEDPLTFTDITLTNTYGKINRITKDKETVTFPVTLAEGEKLQIELDELIGLYSAHQAYIRLSGSVGEKSFSEIRGSMINHPPSAAWIKERVEKHLE